MLDIIYVGIDGSHWTLDGHGGGEQGVFTTSLAGFVGQAEVAATPGPGRVGAVSTGLPDIKPFTGELNVVLSPLTARHTTSLPDIVQAWRRAWSTLADGELIVRSRGLRLRTRARLDEPMEFPTRSPYGVRTRILEMPVSVECRDGVWLGPPESIVDGLVVNGGELVAWPRVEWTGTGTVTAPGASLLALPETSMPAVLDCDPATGCQITVDGEPAPDLWSQLRGRTFPRGVPPGGADQWQFSTGLDATVTARVLDPWGW